MFRRNQFQGNYRRGGSGNVQTRQTQPAQRQETGEECDNCGGKILEGVCQNGQNQGRPYRCCDSQKCYFEFTDTQKSQKSQKPQRSQQTKRLRQAYDPAEDQIPDWGIELFERMENVETFLSQMHSDALNPPTGEGAKEQVQAVQAAQAASQNQNHNSSAAVSAAAIQAAIQAAFANQISPPASQNV